MTQKQSECIALLQLGEDGVWFCPKCGFKLILPKPTRRRNAAQDCADKSGPYSNPID